MRPNSRRELDGNGETERRRNERRRGPFPDRVRDDHRRGYLFLDAIHVVSRFGFRTSLYSFGGFHLRSGMVLVPFIFGVGMIFYNARNWLGWLLSPAAAEC